MSCPYEYVVRFLSINELIRPYDLIDKEYTLTIESHFETEAGDTKPYKFQGHCAKIEQVGKTLDQEYFIYQLVLVPKLTYLERTRYSEIFLEKTPKAIVTAILQRHRMADAMKFWPGTGDSPNYEYKVQFEESDFEFCQRLLAEEGIFYFFDRDKDKTKLIFGDKTSHYLSEQLINYQSERHSSYSEMAVHSSSLSEHNPSNRIAYRAYNHLSPDMRLAKNSQAKTPAGTFKTIAAESELYSFIDSRNYNSSDRVSKINAIERERIAAESAIINMDANTIALYPGKTVVVESEEDFVAAEKKLVVIASEWFVDLAPSQTNHSGSRVTNSLTCIPHSKVFRPAKPDQPKRIPGLQTATVVGQSGAVLDTEGHLRVKVQFHWDKLGAHDRNSSCWIRVTQGIAGEGYGMFFPPRIGQEVVVGFLGGDPDAPILIGSVYNGQQKAPYKYPSNQNRSGFRSRTVGGDTGKFNEVSFEDTAGKEELFFKAQKDHKIRVLDSENRKVDVNRVSHIGNDDTLNVDHDQKITIGNNLTETIAKDHSCTSTNYALKQGESYKHDVGTSYTLTVGAAKTDTIAKNYEVTVSGAKELSIAKNYQVKANDAIEIESPKMITLKCGGAKIEMTPGVINITGMVYFN